LVRLLLPGGRMEPQTGPPGMTRTVAIASDGESVVEFMNRLESGVQVRTKSGVDAAQESKGIQQS